MLLTMSRTIRVLAAFAILVAIATQCGCAELTIAEARAQEASSVGSFAELTGEAPQTAGERKKPANKKCNQ